MGQLTSSSDQAFAFSTLQPRFRGAFLLAAAGFQTDGFSRRRSGFHGFSKFRRYVCDALAIHSTAIASDVKPETRRTLPSDKVTLTTQFRGSPSLVPRISNRAFFKGSSLLGAHISRGYLHALSATSTSFHIALTGSSSGRHGVRPRRRRGGQQTMAPSRRSVASRCRSSPRSWMRRIAFTSFPRDNRSKIDSINPLERLNGEIKRRRPSAPNPQK